MKKVMLVMLVVLGVGFFAGCSSNDSETTGENNIEEIEAPTILGEKLEDLDSGGTLNGQYAGKKITVATRTGDFEDALKKAAEYFEAASGATVEIQSFPAGNDEEKIQLDLSTSKTFDAVLMPVANIKSYAESGYLRELDSYIESVASPNLELDDFIPSVLDLYGKYEDKLVAFPYKPDTQIFFYRKDLFEDPEIQEEYEKLTGEELTVPKTNEELIKVAEFFTKSQNPDSPTNYGYLSMGSTTNSRLIWMNRLGEYGGSIMGENYEVTIDNPTTKSAIDDMMALKESAPEEWTQLGWDEANAMFVNGEAAMMEQWPGLIGSINGEDSQVKDRVGYAVTPGASPTLGGWSIAMTSNSKEDELAYKFIEFVTSKDGELLKIENTMDPTRMSTYARGEVMESNTMYRVLLESLNSGKHLVDVEIPFISALLNDILEDETIGVLSDEKTIDSALKEMQKKFEEEITKAGLK